MALIKFIAQCIKFSLTGIVLILTLCVVRTTILSLNRSSALVPCHVGDSVGYIHADDAIWDRLKSAIRIKSISYAKGNQEYDELMKLHNFIIESYPQVFKSEFVTYETVSKYSLLIRVQGSDKDLEPYMVAAHMDVVPVIKDKWSVEAFDAVDENGKLYGRGTMDDKVMIFAQLEALSYLLQKGHQPKRGFYLAYGHDEEIRGEAGAQKIASTLRKRGVEHLHFILDEGLMLLTDFSSFLNNPLSPVGVTEKGYMNINMSVELEGGHSSMPGKESAISVMANAIVNVQNHGMTLRIDEIFKQQLLEISFLAPFPFNYILSNTWCFGPFLKMIVKNDPLGRSLMTTVSSVTMMKGGIKENVIPTSAWAIVNFRTHQQDDMDEVLRFVREVINDDRIQIDVTDKWESHPVSPHDKNKDLPFQVLHDTIKQIFPTAAVVPGNLVGNTDTEHYLNFTDAIYRFQPRLLPAKDIKRFHGPDEYIMRKNFEEEINFYHHLIINADRKELIASPEHTDL